MDRRGSSTVYLLLVMTGLIAMGLIFIDVTRIIVAENRVERAAKTAGNSLLASYNRNMALDFGLFGEGSPKASQEAVFQYYFKRNLDPEQSRLGLRYFVESKDCEVEALQNLMEDNVLKSQMIGNVKYKSPGKWIKSLAEIFSGKEIEALRGKNQEARNAREQKRALKRKQAELQARLMTVKGDAQESLIRELSNVTKTLDKMEESMNGRSNSEAKIPNSQTAGEFFSGKLNEMTGLKNCTVPGSYYPKSYSETGSGNFNGYSYRANTEEERESLDQSALKTLMEFGVGIREIASGSLDKLYMTEYIIDRFSSLLNEKEGHFYRKGEIEYIISGSRNTTELTAISLTVMKIWTIRFAINFIIDISKSLIPEPMERLAYSLMSAGLEASTDVVKLMTGYTVEALPNSPKKITLSYEDHLRILLGMKSEKNLLDGARLMVNCSSVSKGGPEISRMGTFFRVKYKASINLIFIPVLKPELFSSSFKNGKYAIEREEFFGY